MCSCNIWTASQSNHCSFISVVTCLLKMDNFFSTFHSYEWCALLLCHLSPLLIPGLPIIHELVFFLSCVSKVSCSFAPSAITYAFTRLSAAALIKKLVFRLPRLFEAALVHILHPHAALNWGRRLNELIRYTSRFQFDRRTRGTGATDY